MTVKQLRDRLVDIPGDLVVLVDGAFDHGYHRVYWAKPQKVESYEHGAVFKEYWDDQPASDEAEILDAFVVGIS